MNQKCMNQTVQSKTFEYFKWNNTIETFKCLAVCSVCVFEEKTIQTNVDEEKHTTIRNFCDL